MSSDLKDARWQLAIETATEDGYEWDKLPYKHWQMYLDAAQLVLGLMPHLVGGLAAKFRNEGER